MDVANTLHRAGALVSVFDPAALDNARRLHPDLGYGTSALCVARNADVVVLLTEWSEFREITPAAMGAVVAHRRIVDSRQALDPHQ